MKRDKENTHGCSLNLKLYETSKLTNWYQMFLFKKKNKGTFWKLYMVLAIVVRFPNAK